MIKKWAVYTVLVFAGIFLGYLFFGTSNSSTTSTNEKVDTLAFGRWTCSMHPSVSGEKNGICPFCGMNLVLMSAKPEVLATNQIAMSEEALALANIQTTIVGIKDSGGVSLTLSGTVTTNKETDAIQTILFDGRLETLYPNYVGKKVASGQKIGKVYSPELYLAQDKLLTSVSYKETHKNLYDVARNTLGLWKVTDKQIDEIIANGKPLVDFPLYADVNGTVTEVLAAEGNYYKQGDALYKVSDLRSVWVVLDAYEEQLPLLKVGQEVELYFTGMPTERLIAKISFVEPIMQKKKRTISVRILVKNPEGKLKPGMFAEANIKVGTDKENIVTVPKSAVLWTGKRSIVYRKPYPDHPVFELVEIELGQSFSDSYEVLSGLALDDEIVVHGAFTVDAAAQLMGQKSMMNQVKPTYNNRRNKEFNDKDFKDLKPLVVGQSTNTKELLLAYFDLKNALVKSDYEIAQKRANQLNGLLQAALKNDLFQEQPGNTVRKKLALLLNTKDIESIRGEFKPFSHHFINLIKTIDSIPMPVYVQFCPMADEGKGASWLSPVKKIENPYYGHAMLNCGVVKEEVN